MKKVIMYWSNVCIMHKKEMEIINQLKNNLLADNIELDVRMFGIGYPCRMSEYMSEPEAIMPDIIVSTDLEVFEEPKIFNKYKDNLHNLKNMYQIKDSYLNTNVSQYDDLLPFLIIPLIFYSNKPIQNELSIKDLITSNRDVCFGGINNSGAKAIIKGIWDMYGKDKLVQLLEHTHIVDMPIMSFNNAKKGLCDIAITPSIYALRADNETAFVAYPKEGAIALPSYISASKDCDQAIVIKVLDQLLAPSVCDVFVEFANLACCIEGSAVDYNFEVANVNHIYPSTTWFNETKHDEFMETYQKYID